MVNQATSLRMAAVKQRDTHPERIIRSVLHRMGYRYRLHARELPGCPDIVFRPKKKVIFVHGCFWHRHDCRRTTTPIVRRAYWTQKFERTVARDHFTQQKLQNLGWKLLVVWECQTKSFNLETRLRRFLESN